MRLPLIALSVLVLAPHSYASYSVLSITNNDLAISRATGEAYITRPTSAGTGAGDHLVQINLATGASIRSVYLGSNPTRLELTDSGQNAFVGLAGASAFTRVNLSTFTAGPTVSLGSSPDGPMYAGDIAVSPGSEDTVALARRLSVPGAENQGVVIFDGTVMRPTATPSNAGSTDISFGSNPARLYGYNNISTEYGWRRMTVGPSGVAIQDVTTHLVTGSNVFFKMYGGYAVFTRGTVIDAENRTLVATLTVPSGVGVVETDAANNRVYLLSGIGTTKTLTAYSMTTFTAIGSETIFGITGIASSLSRFGADGLAFRTPTQVFTIHTSLVPEPGVFAPMMLGTLWVLRRKRR